MALIRSWHQVGEPKPKAEHSTFRSWSLTIGGILEHAGFASPVPAQRDSDRRRHSDSRYGKPRQRLEVARENRLFARLIPEEGEMDATNKTRLSLLTRKYIGRIFCSHLRFDLIGDTRGTERFIVTEMKAKIT